MPRSVRRGHRLAAAGGTLIICLFCPILPLAAQGSETRPEDAPKNAPETTAAPWYQAVALNGLLSTSFTHNFNRPDSRTNQFRVFDFDDGSLKLDVVELVVQKPAAERGQAGFRLDATDRSNVPVFERRNALDTGQATISANLIYFF
jgi:hypothetical protein